MVAFKINLLLGLFSEGPYTKSEKDYSNPEFLFFFLVIQLYKSTWLVLRKGFVMWMVGDPSHWAMAPWPSLCAHQFGFISTFHSIPFSQSSNGPTNSCPPTSGPNHYPAYLHCEEQREPLLLLIKIISLNIISYTVVKWCAIHLNIIPYWWEKKKKKWYPR